MSLCASSLSQLYSQKQVIFVPVSILACSGGQAEMQGPRHRLQVMLRGLAGAGESRKVLVDQL